jgi:hypothetical protein
MFNKYKELVSVKKTLERARDKIAAATENKYDSTFQEIIDDVELELETLKDVFSYED